MAFEISLREQADILNAAIEGKAIEWFNDGVDDWVEKYLIDSPNFNFYDTKYRIKSEKKWVPWKDTSHLNNSACFKHKEDSAMVRIYPHSFSEHDVYLFDDHHSIRELFDGWLISFDHGQTWQPCGNEE